MSLSHGRPGPPMLIRCLALVAALVAAQAAQATVAPGPPPGGGNLPNGNGPCAGTDAEVTAAVCQYAVSLSPYNGAFAYRYDFTLTVPNALNALNWTLGAIEIPLFDATAILPGSITLEHWASNNGWTAAIVSQGDAGWDWSFADPGGAKAAWGDVSTVLKVSTTDPAQYVPISEVIGLSFYSAYAPTTGPYQLTLSTDPADAASNFTAFVDPPVPAAPAAGNTVPEPGTLALVALCLTVPGLRAGIRARRERILPAPAARPTRAS